MEQNGKRLDDPSGRRLVTVFGGTGFLGRRIVRSLLGRGVDVRIASRHPEGVSALFGATTRQPEALRVDIHDDASVIEALVGAYAAVNAVSLYVERSHETFEAVHVTAAARVAKSAGQSGVGRLVHISGVGADPSASARYIRARGRGEAVVREHFPDATIVRPTVMFGPDDAFLSKLVPLTRRLPVYPMFGRGQTRLQPVGVEDVAEATACILLKGSDGPSHRTYELGGPRRYTYEELVRSIATALQTRTRPVAMPFAAWHALAWGAEFLPNAPLTRDQIALMRSDNVAADDLPGLRDLGITPTSIEDAAAMMGAEPRK